MQKNNSKEEGKKPQSQPRPGIQKKMQPIPDSQPRQQSGKMENKILFITGGDSGIGKACALLFAQEGATKKDRKAEKKEEKRKRTNAIIKQEEEGVLAYNKQAAFGLQLRTNGYAAFFELGRMKSPRFTNLYLLEVSEIFHPKEEKVPSTDQNYFGGSFKYGKINNFYQAKLGFGQQYVLGQKGNKNGIDCPVNVY